MKRSLCTIAAVILAFLLGRYVTERSVTGASVLEPEPVRGAPQKGHIVPARSITDATQHKSLGRQVGTPAFPKEYEYLDGTVRDERVRANRIQNQNEYQAMFQGMGMTPDEIEEVLSRLDAVFELSIIAGDSRMDLMRNRKKFDERMHDILGSDSYARFREYEEAKKSAREMKSINDFAVRANAALDPRYQDTIKQAIAEAEVYSIENYGGPYDPLPRPNTDREGGFDVKVQLETLRNNYEKLVPRLLTSLPEDQVGIVQAYYESWMASSERTIQMLTADPETRRKLMAEEVNRVNAQVERLQEAERAKLGIRQGP